MKKCFDTVLIFVFVCGLSGSIDMRPMFEQFANFLGLVPQNNTPKARKKALKEQIDAAERAGYWLTQSEQKRLKALRPFCSQCVQIIQKAETPEERFALLKGDDGDVLPVLSVLIPSDLPDTETASAVFTLCTFLTPHVAYEVLTQQSQLASARYNELFFTAVLSAKAQTVAAFLRLFSTNTVVLTKFLQLRNGENKNFFDLLDDMMSLETPSFKNIEDDIAFYKRRTQFKTITASLRSLQKDMAHRALLFKMVQKPQRVDVRINFK